MMMPGRPTILTTVGQGPAALEVGAGAVTLIYPFLLFLPLSGLVGCFGFKSQMAIKPKSTNQPTNHDANYHEDGNQRIQVEKILISHFSHAGRSNAACSVRMRART